jgi:small-conductance mechanosensitive channel
VVTGVVLAFDTLGFELSLAVGERLRDVLPRVLASALLLVAGVLAAMALGALTRRFFDSAGLRGGRLRGQLVTATFTLFAALLALEQLGFAAQFVMAVGVVAVAALGLAAGLAFGLGCRDLARDFVVEYLRSIDEERPAGRP